MTPDPFVAALAAVVETALERGLAVTPLGEGWLVRLAPTDYATGTGTPPEPQARRAW